MTTFDVLQETYIALSANKARSGLTILGIIIGISSVIAMTAIGQGAQNAIQSQIQSIGSNLILVSELRNSFLPVFFPHAKNLQCT